MSVLGWLARGQPQRVGVVEGKRGEMRGTALVLKSHLSRSIRCSKEDNHLFSYCTWYRMRSGLRIYTV